MQIIVNGRVCHVPAATLADLLEQFLSTQPALAGRTRLTVGTALNGIFVPREQRRHCQLKPGDRVEILSPRQGDEAMKLLGETLASRLFLGTGRYSSLELLSRTLRTTRPGLVTASIRQAGPAGVEAQGLADILLALDIPILPNTAGCQTARDAVTTAQIAREMFGTEWIKLEVIGSPRWLEPDVVGLIEAATILADEGFEVFPYTTEDLRVAERLLHAGCRVLMPWAAPIGSGRGLEAQAQLARLRAAFPDVPMIIDAGIGRPSQAAAALEMGFDAVLLNTAVAEAGDPPLMAQAFKAAIEAGRLAYEAGLMAPRNEAAASTPDEGKASFA